MEEVAELRPGSRTMSKIARNRVVTLRSKALLFWKDSKAGLMQGRSIKRRYKFMSPRSGRRRECFRCVTQCFGQALLSEVWPLSLSVLCAACRPDDICEQLFDAIQYMNEYCKLRKLRGSAYAHCLPSVNWCLVSSLKCLMEAPPLREKPVTILVHKVHESDPKHPSHVPLCLAPLTRRT